MSEMRIENSKYQKPKRFFSPVGVFLGFILGLAVALFIAWYLLPVEPVDVAPWQLRESDRIPYMIGIALAYADDGDLDRAISRLVNLRLPGDPIQAMADAACQLTSSGFVNSTSGLRAVRAMVSFYAPQGRTSCADVLIRALPDSTQVVQVVLPTNTPTLTPAATKTATPESAVLATQTPISVALPTAQNTSQFETIAVNTLCSAAESGQIQVLVYELNGSTGIPGQPIRVRWNDGESRFFTGLKPELGPGYADFQMSESEEYIVDMPGLSDPVSTALSAVPCVDPITGELAITSYRVIFRSSF